MSAARSGGGRRWPRPGAVGGALADYAQRVWVNCGDDNIFFLAGGIAFNILLVAVPFVFLLVSGLSYVLNAGIDASTAEVIRFVHYFLPPHSETESSPIHTLISDLLNIRVSVGVISAIGLLWFSTRLFGSLRAVLAEVFDIDYERGIVAGKLFDLQMSFLAMVLITMYLAFSAYLAIATSRGVAALVELGLRQDVMGGVEYIVGRAISFAVVVVGFYTMYRYLPLRRIRWQQALVGALTAALLFEIARNLYTGYTKQFDPGSIYSGSFYAIASVVFWVYYAALVFILGGEVAQAHEVRRRLRLQRETFADDPR